MTVAQGTPSLIQRLRDYADNPANKGFVPISPHTLREVAAELAALSAQVVAKDKEMVARIADLLCTVPTGAPFQSVLKRAEAAEAQVVELQKDARRYRWLKANEHLLEWRSLRFVELDAAIDAAKVAGSAPHDPRGDESLAADGDDP